MREKLNILKKDCWSNRDWLMEIIGRCPFNYARMLQTNKSYSTLIDDITQYSVEHLPQNREWTFNTKVYWYLHSLVEFPKCENSNCGNVIVDDVINVKTGYRRFCSKKCSQSSDVTKEQRKTTNRQKYGVSCSLLGEEAKKKTRLTNMERYGVDNVSKSHMIRERMKQTNRERYGTDYSWQAEYVKDKIRQTSLMRYGVEHPMQSQQIQNKVIDTCLWRYGVPYSYQSEIVKDKIRQSHIERYGGIGFASRVISEKILETNNHRYGVDNPFESPDIQQKIRNTNLERYGVEYPTMSSSILEKIRATMLERYGFDNFSKTEQFHKLRRKKFVTSRFPNMEFDSRWEISVYEYCTDMGLSVEYQPSMCFPYEYMGESHTYHPDFLINGQLYEVKGDHFFNESGQMVNPYDHSQDGKYEAKHQCMLRNGVKILRHSDILKIRNGTFEFGEQ